MTRGSWTSLLLVLALTNSACVHLTPYYRGGRVVTAAPLEPVQIDHRLLLIGDAGDANPDGEPALELLARQVRQLPDRTTVTFLGDNVYERGMPEVSPEAVDAAAQAANVILPKVFDSRHEAERCLDAQIDTVRGTRARAIFIPGNHDWDPFEADGWRRVLAQANYLRASVAADADVAMLPEGGCPGPVPVELGKHGMLIALDTQWFLEFRLRGKPGPENNPTRCAFTTEEDVVKALASQLASAARQRRWVIVVGHHPLNSAGPHGGFVDPLTHLFPLRFLRHYVPFYLEWLPMPVLGTFAVLARQNFSPSPQDASNAKNEQLRLVLRRAMAESEKNGGPVLAYAAGHDHSLQVFKTPVGPRYSLVSGLGSSSRASEVGATHNTLFAHANPQHPGFMQLDFLRNGHVRLSVIESDGTAEAATSEVFSMMIADADTPRGARPVSKPEGVWSRVRERASSVWRGWRGKGAE